MLLFLLFSLAAAHYDDEKEFGYDRLCYKRWPPRKVLISPPKVLIERPRFDVPIVRFPPPPPSPSPIIRVPPPIVQIRPKYPSPQPRLKIIENHQPKYNVETKVAAPVYILPKHGPVVDKRAFRLPPPRPVIIKPRPVIVKAPSFYRPPPVLVRPRFVEVKPSRIYYVKPFRPCSRREFRDADYPYHRHHDHHHQKYEKVYY